MVSKETGEETDKRRAGEWATRKTVSYSHTVPDPGSDTGGFESRPRLVGSMAFLPLPAVRSPPLCQQPPSRSQTRPTRLCGTEGNQGKVSVPAGVPHEQRERQTYLLGRLIGCSEGSFRKGHVGVVGKTAARNVFTLMEAGDGSAPGQDNSNTASNRRRYQVLKQAMSHPDQVTFQLTSWHGNNHPDLQETEDDCDGHHDWLDGGLLPLGLQGGSGQQVLQF